MSKKQEFASIRLEEDLINLIKRELVRRRGIEPWRQHTIGDFLRERAWVYFKMKESGSELG